MDADMLSIRLSQESECWDDMVEKVIKYLAKHREEKLKQKEFSLEEARKKDEIKENRLTGMQK
jgi:hypothetical protein